jgi:histidinol-phosphate aminotransferase
MSHFAEIVPEHIRSLPAYVPGKAIAAAENGRRPVKLASNENPFGPSPRAERAAAEALTAANLYPDTNSTALAEALAQRHGIGAENLIVAAGASSVLVLLSRILLGPGLNAIGAERSFISYPILTRAADAEYRTVPMRGDGLDLDAMAGAVDDNTRLIFLTNPNNPTGTIVTAAELDAFLDRLPASAVVVLDEAYYDFAEAFAHARGVDYSHAERYVREGRNVVALRTFSKAQGLAALRVGYGMGPAELIGYLKRLQPTFEVSSAGQAAALASMTDHEHYQKTLRNNCEQAAWLVRQLEEMGYEPVETWANFLYCEVDEDAAALAQRLEREGVSIRPLCGAWGARTAIRITIGTPEENRRFVEALKAVTASVG